LSEVFVAKLVVSYVFLGYASISDWRKREVADKVWLGLGGIGAALTVYDIYSFAQPFGFTRDVISIIIIPSIISILLTSVIAYIIFQSGLFGGADAKAFMAVSLMMPLLPFDLTTSLPILPISTISNPFFPLAVFNNAVLLSATMAIYILGRNFYWKVIQHRPLFNDLPDLPLRKRILAVVTGYKVPSNSTDKLHFYRVLTQSFNGHLQLRLRSDEEKASPELISSVKEIWITPLLPMMIFILLGFTFALLFGDFALGIVSGLGHVLLGI
jgi:archaeal preflagellin peptidase FlaK